VGLSPHLSGDAAAAFDDAAAPRYSKPKYGLPTAGRNSMADHKHGEMDISDHERTFEGFITWTKWSIIVILAILVLMAVFLI
jgi:hypothetical protein